MTGEVDFDVVVVGAGISGLCAAKLLHEQFGLKIKVLEARDRVGGRTQTLKDEYGGYVDVGGAYIGPTQYRVYRLVKEFGLQLYDVNEKERTVLSLKGIWKCFRGSIPSFWNPFALLDLNHVMRTVDSMSEEVPLDAPWTAPKAKVWDTMTVKEFVDGICWLHSTKALLEVAVESIVTSQLHEVSLLYFLWYVHSGQGLMCLTSVTGGAQEKKMVGGTQQISEKLSSSLGPGAVQLSSPVVRIQQRDDQVKVTTSSGTVLTSRYVISAVPLALLNRIWFEPVLPGLKLQLIQRAPMGSIIKTIMYYDTAFWKDLDFCGASISEDGPIGYSIDDTKPDGSSPAIMGFILADKCRQLSQLTVEERKEALCRHYAEIFKCTQFLKPVKYVEKNWMEEEYSGGCYCSTLPPGVLTSYGRVLREPMGRIYFAGTETATYWFGYMEGAIQAGERAAREVLQRMGNVTKAEVWQDEPESVHYPVPPKDTNMIETMLPSVGGVVKFCLFAVVGVSAVFIGRLLGRL